MSSKEVVSGAVAQDTYNDLEDYREERDMSRSAAVDRLLEDALESEDNGSSDVLGEKLVVFASVASLLAVLLTGAWAVAPSVLPAPALAWFWVVAGAANLVDAARHRRRRDGPDGGSA